MEDVELNDMPKEETNEVTVDDAREEETYKKELELHTKQHKDTTLSEKWTGMIQAIHVPIIAAIHGVTQMAAKNPKRTLSVIAVVSLFLLVVGLFTNFSVDVDEDKLWTPSGSRSLQHMDWIDNDSGFPEDTNNLLMFFHTNGDNVLGRDEVSRIFEALDAVRAVENYDNMCLESFYMNASGEKTCEIDGVVNFWGLDSALFEAEVSSDEEAIAAMSVPIFPNGSPVSESSILGNPRRDEDGLLTFAQSYTVIVKFPPTDAAETFEDNVLDVLLDMRDEWSRDKDNTLVLEVTADGSFSDEFERAIINDIPLIPIVFIIMSIFTAIVFFKPDKVKSRSLLGFGAVVTVLLSILSGFGFLFLCGVPFTSMTQILPFVIFGIGLDDAFIIFGAFSRTDSREEIVERIRKTIDDAGISITLTTMTSILAFGLGCLSTIPAVYWLCLYAFPTIAFIYMYQLTFFIAWIVLDEQRLQNNRRDCCFCITADKDPEEENSTAESQESSAKESFLDTLMGRYANFLLQPAVKVVVVLSFAALAVLCAISASELKQSFEFTDVMPDDSYVTDFFEAFDEYSQRNSVGPYVYFRNVNQADESIQDQMETYVNELVALDAVEDPPENFWLHDFKAYVESNSLAELTFNEQIDLFLSDTVYFDLYTSNIVRDEKGAITSSRVKIFFDNVDIEDVNDQIDTLQDQRAVSKRQPINAGEKDWNFFSYDGIYNIWEFYAVSAEELMFTTIMGVAAVTGIALVFVPHYTAALFVLPLICLLYVDLLGTMQWAGVSVNPVSYIALVMSIGLLVDFIMHVLLRYYECPGNRREKTVEMLKTMGSSVFIGGVSTFLGTLPLAFSSSTIFYTIFIAFVGLVTLGIGHGLILLPVILSILGPEDQTATPNKEEDTDASIRTSPDQPSL